MEHLLSKWTVRYKRKSPSLRGHSADGRLVGGASGGLWTLVKAKSDRTEYIKIYYLNTVDGGGEG